MRVGSAGHVLHLRQSGVGLIEVLVAVLVLSIGLLGLAGLQLRTLRDNQSALERGVAVIETHAIADAMRADRINASNGLFDIALADDKPTDLSTFANAALEAWRSNLEGSLGDDATGQVDCNGFLCTIIVQWDDRRGTGGSVTQQVSTQVQL
jgi:type IV pilus assembly protein PilV